MAGTVEDLEADKKLRDEVASDEFDDDDGIEDLQQRDMEDAIDLLQKCMHLLDYVSDRDFCKAISKRERDNLTWMSEQIREYLDDVEGHYEEKVEE